MLMLGFFSKLMMVVGLVGFIYGWFKEDNIVKTVSLIILGSGVVFWAMKALVGVTFFLVVISLLAAGIVYAFKKSPKKREATSND